MKTRYFVGKDYDTLTEKDIIFNNYDKLKQDKLTFLNDLYDNENTFKSMWSVYTNHIYDYEKELGKDAMFFSNIEIDNLLARKFQYSESNRVHIYNFINVYKEWGTSKGYIQHNAVNALNRDESVKSSRKIIINKLWGLGKFYNLLAKIERTNGLAYCIPLLLARYGIFGKELIEMRQLRWEDVDYEKKQVRIITSIGRKILDVDDRFVQWIEKYQTSNKEDEIDYGYVLRKSKKTTGGKDTSNMLSRHTIDTRIRTACIAVNINRISLGDLVKSRYMDYMLEIRKDRKLSSDDMDWIQLNFRGETSTTILVDLIKMYETASKDTVIMKNTVGRLKESLKDPLSKEFTKDLIKNIGFEEFIDKNEVAISKESNK